VAPKKPSWATDPLEGALGAGPAAVLRGAGRYIGGGLQDFLGSQAVRESPFGAASTLFAPRKAYALGDERQGPYVPERLQRAPSAPVLSGYQSRVPITSPNTTFQNADDEYNRLKAQFGGTTGVSQLAGMTSLPTGFTPTGGKQAAGLKDYYAAQQEVGERNIGEIIGGLEYQKGSPMEQWAKANPMLAMREYNKKFPAGEATQGPSDDAIRAAISGGKFYPSEGSPSPVTNPPDFGTPANTVPGPPMQQGAGVMEAFKPGIALSAANTAGATGMWNFQTTPESQNPGMNFLDAFKKNPQFDAYMLGAGARLGDYFQGIGR
jgi:hypothetical protein